MHVPDEIRPVLSQYDAAPGPLHVEYLAGAGGFSGARFWRIKAADQVLALRQWPAEHPTEDRLHFIHAVLAHVERRGLKLVPVPIASGSGSTFVRYADRFWQLEPWLRGSGDYSAQPSPQRLRSAMTTLARFHLVASDFPRSETLMDHSHGVVQRVERLKELRSGGLDELRQRIDTSQWPEFAILARRCCDLADRAMRRFTVTEKTLVNIDVPRQPVIGDIWHDNVLFDGETVTGLVDFGAMCVDTVARDVARLLGGMAQDDPDAWREGLDAYQAVRPLDQSEYLFTGIFDQYNVVLSGLNWVKWIYEERREFDDRAAVLARMRHFVTRLSRWSV